MQQNKTPRIGEPDLPSTQTELTRSDSDKNGMATTPRPPLEARQPQVELGPLVDASLINVIATKLVVLRYKIVPLNSRREWLYMRYVRPLLLRGFFKGRSDLGGFDLNGPRVVTVTPPQFVREDVREILIIKCDHIGDFFLSLNAFLILRKAFQNARLTLLCGPWNEAIAGQSGIFDRVACVDVFPELAEDQSVTFDASVLDSFNFPFFDIAVDLRPDGDTAFLLDHVGAHIKGRFRNPKLLETYTQGPENQPYLDFVIDTPDAVSGGRSNQARHTRTLLSLMASGLVDLFDAQEQTATAIAPYIDQSTSQILKRRGRGPLIAINTGAGAKIKAWPLENYIGIIRRLIANHDVTIVLLGGGRQKPDGVEIAAACASENIIDLIGAVSLVELPNIIAQLDLYIGNDTGGTHIASLIGQKTLCLYAGTSLIETFGPVGKQVTILRCVGLHCAPCRLTRLSDCKHDHKCMVSITQERVIAEIERILELPVSTS